MLDLHTYENVPSLSTLESCVVFDLDEQSHIHSNVSERALPIYYALDEQNLSSTSEEMKYSFLTLIRGGKIIPKKERIFNMVEKIIRLKDSF
jgi:hypothetical protein